MIQNFAPKGHRSDSVAYNGILFCAGMVADDLSKDANGQTAEICVKIDKLLADAGTSKERLLNATIWLADVREREDIGEAWNAWVVEGHQPARSCIGATLGKGIKVEIAVVAAMPD